VYLPPGDWCDVRSGRWQEGSTVVLLSAGLDEDLPILARAGAIVPMAPAVRWTDERPLDPLLLHVFPDRDGSAAGSLYEDDGESTAYLKDLTSVTRFAASLEAGVRVLTSRREGQFRPPPRMVEVIVHDRDGEHRATVEDAPTWELAIPAEAR
jgi:alpha-glucosidase